MDFSALDGVELRVDTGVPSVESGAGAGCNKSMKKQMGGQLFISARALVTNLLLKLRARLLTVSMSRLDSLDY